MKSTTCTSRDVIFHSELSGRFCKTVTTETVPYKVITKATIKLPQQKIQICNSMHNAIEEDDFLDRMEFSEETTFH